MHKFWKNYFEIVQVWIKISTKKMGPSFIFISKFKSSFKKNINLNSTFFLQNYGQKNCKKFWNSNFSLYFDFEKNFAKLLSPIKFFEPRKLKKYQNHLFQWKLFNFLKFPANFYFSPINFLQNSKTIVHFTMTIFKQKKLQFVPASIPCQFPITL